MRWARHCIHCYEITNYLIVISWNCPVFIAFLISCEAVELLPSSVNIRSLGLCKPLALSFLHPLEPKRSSGWDEISPFLIETFLEVFLIALNFPNKLFFKNCYFPWTSKILHSWTDPKEVKMSVLGWIQSDLSPLLSTFSKIFEIVLSKRLVEYLWLNTFFDYYQLGFQKGSETKGQTSSSWIECCWLVTVCRSVVYVICPKRSTEWILMSWWQSWGATEFKGWHLILANTLFHRSSAERSHQLPFSEWISEGNFEHPSGFYLRPSSFTVIYKQSSKSYLQSSHCFICCWYIIVVVSHKIKETTSALLIK